MEIENLFTGNTVTAEWINNRLTGKTFFMKIRRKENQVVGGTMHQHYTVLNLRLKEAEDNAILTDSLPPVLQGKVEELTSSSNGGNEDREGSESTKDNDSSVFNTSV
ncbi:hypothetical protein ACJIZ3_023382 [Penstemon smallii]|uniref:Uncharacterized protein n=1 Tax=Penstemon smallii TaxID=265156 RepID=A0ABD3TNX9_9LAMI